MSPATRSTPDAPARAFAVTLRPRGCGWWLLLAATACGGDAPPPPLLRDGALGSLRDLVFYERGAAGGPLFFDRFEATRGDFAGFAATDAGRAAGIAVRLAQLSATAQAAPLSADEAVLPMAGVDLAQARAFSRWRCCRLPRSDEWTFVCTTDGRDTFPWGTNPSPARANTSDLGVYAPLPVGTFESGRSGDGPYDLIGNVAEWTETVPGAWFHFDRDWLSPMALAARRADRIAALAVWRLPGTVVPPAVVVAVASREAPREVLGADFASSMLDGPRLRSPVDRGDTLGVRLCTTPDELVIALAARRSTFTAGDRTQIERFCRRRNHAVVLRAAVQRLRPQLDAAGLAWFEAFLP